MIGLLNDAARRNRLEGLRPVFPPEQAQPSYWVPAMRQVADQVTVRPEILGLVSQLAIESRPAPYGNNKRTRLGVSTRGCLSFVRCAKTWAIAHGRSEVGPDDIVELIPSVFGHRILLTDEALFDEVKVWDPEGGPSVIKELLDKVNLPHRRKR
jgi:MoxR-like ATPase